MLVRTPLVNTAGGVGPTAFITNTVVANLRNMKLTGSNPQADFSIENVTVPLQGKYTQDYPTGTVRTPKAPFVFTQPPAVAGGAAGPAAGQAQPIPAPVAPANGGAAGADQYPDPLHPGESMADDSLVTVLIAVVVDPPHPARRRRLLPAAGK